MAGVKDKVAIVTGAGGSLGSAEARLLARNGAKVVLTDLHADAIEGIAAELTDEGHEAVALTQDVTSEDDWARIMAATVERFGRLDVLVNNAGVNLKTRAELHERSVADWDMMMDTNGKSVFLGTRHAIPLLREAGGGSIVNISSVAGLGRSKVLEGIYAATKAAVFMLTRVTAAQYGADNIRANSVHPGPMMSEMLMGYYSTPELKAERLSLVPLNRFGEPDDIAHAVMFLASDEASYITGTSIVVDGGSLAQ